MVQMTARSAVSEDGKVGERSNNNVTLDDRHGSQVTDGTNIETDTPVSSNLSNHTGTSVPGWSDHAMPTQQLIITLLTM